MKHMRKECFLNLCCHLFEYFKFREGFSISAPDLNLIGLMGFLPYTCTLGADNKPNSLNYRSTKYDINFVCEITNLTIS